MGSVQLQKTPDMDVTLVRNIFIDEYMPKASGEFVKVYLYLLRCTSGEKETSVSALADIFDLTEKDVSRALHYWEKMRLMSLSYDTNGNLTAIGFPRGRKRKTSPRFFKTSRRLKQNAEAFLKNLETF